MKSLTHVTLLFFILGFTGVGVCQESAPPNIAAALTMKVVKYERNISGGGEVSIYVLGNPEVQAQLAQGIGKKIGSAVLKSVEGGDALPGNPPSILFVGSPSKLESALEYTRGQKILSATNIPDLVPKGVTLGLAVGDDGKPRIVINLTSSSEENLNWNAAIMKVAQTIK